MDAPVWHLEMQNKESCLTRVRRDGALTAPVTKTHILTAGALTPYNISAFYSSFWPAHPFLPPLKHLKGHIGEDGGTELPAAIDLMGFKYVGRHSGGMVPQDIEQGLHEYPQNGFSVQALILFAIFFHMTNRREQAQMALQQAVKIALGIGLDKTSFAATHGRGIPSIEESWRRTWWELYVLDVMFAALYQMSKTHLKDRPLEVLLPCAEEIYRTGDALPEPRSLTEFDVRFYMDDGVEYSSFSYRIAAARALTKVIMVCCTLEVPPWSSIRDAELEMENLRLHLPASMQTYINSGGEVDEVAFQAHMIMNAGTIYLHRPRSLLASSNPEHTIACAPNDSAAISCPTNDHTRKTVEAADEICQMISASSSLLNHTPFFICGIAMQAIVHLGICRLPHLSSSQTLAEQQIKMSIGALRKLSQVWEMAEIVRQDVKNVARALLDTAWSSCSTHTKMVEEKPAMLQPVPEPNRIEDLPLFNCDGMSQVHDDSWIDEFLGVNALS